MRGDISDEFGEDALRVFVRVCQVFDAVLLFVALGFVVASHIAAGLAVGALGCGALLAGQLLGRR